MTTTIGRQTFIDLMARHGYTANFSGTQFNPANVQTVLMGGPTHQSRGDVGASFWVNRSLTHIAKTRGIAGFDVDNPDDRAKVWTPLLKGLGVPVPDDTNGDINGDTPGLGGIPPLAIAAGLGVLAWLGVRR